MSTKMAVTVPARTFTALTGMFVPHYAPVPKPTSYPTTLDIPAIGGHGAFTEAGNPPTVSKEGFFPAGFSLPTFFPAPVANPNATPGGGLAGSVFGPGTAATGSSAMDVDVNSGSVGVPPSAESDGMSGTALLVWGALAAGAAAVFYASRR